jgi:hypothetical protein
MAADAPPYGGPLEAMATMRLSLWMSTRPWAVARQSHGTTSR